MRFSAVQRPSGNNSAGDRANQTLGIPLITGQTDTQLNVKNRRQTRIPVDRYGANATYSLGLRDYL